MLAGAEGTREPYFESRQGLRLPQGHELRDHPLQANRGRQGTAAYRGGQDDMGQYDKYICTTLEKRHLLPGPTPEQRDRLADQGKRISMEHLHWIDEEVIPGRLLRGDHLDMAPQLPQSGDLGGTGQGGLRDPGHVPPRPRLPRTSLLVGDQPRRLRRHRPHGHADGRRDHPSGIELGSLHPRQPAPHARVPHGCAQPDLHAADPALGLRTGRRLHEREGRRDQEGRGGEEGSPDGAASRAERVEIRALYGPRDSSGYRQARIHASPGPGRTPAPWPTSTRR